MSAMAVPRAPVPYKNFNVAIDIYPLETNYAWQQNCEFIEEFTCNGERVLNLHILKAIRSGSQMIVAREGYLAPPA